MLATVGENDMTFRRRLVAIPLAAAALVLAGLLAASAGSPRVVELRVTGRGFEPWRVTLKKGEPVRLVVTRATDDTCATELIVPEQHVRLDLPLGKAVSVTFTPARTGEIRYSCAMGMMGGVLDVR